MVIDAEQYFIHAKQQYDEGIGFFRFGFAIGFADNLEKTAFYKRLVNLKELTEGYDWRNQILNDLPSLRKTIQNEMSANDEEIMVFARRVLEYSTKNEAQPEGKLGFFSKFVNNLWGNK
jgi:hypothetical protein